MVVLQLITTLDDVDQHNWSIATVVIN
jgi:hypothetical protein